MGSSIYKFGNKIRMKNLYLASKNKGKIEEYKKLLAGVNCKLLLQPESLEAVSYTHLTLPTIAKV